jgi:cell division transport system ATP-binding protein
MKKNIIQFQQVNKTYPGDLIALDNVSFDIERGEMVFLAGHSGSGKSTILKLIAGIESASSGSVLVNGIELNTTSQNHRTFIRHHIGFVFQDHKILFDRSVFDNVRLPLDIMAYNETEVRDRVMNALESVGLEQKYKLHPQQLSGGEQQRLCIARAVIHQPQILIADEPTANLDRDNALKILELFKSFHKASATVIISAHDESILSDYGKRIMRMTDGKFTGGVR